mmetsp:Transcript_5011/g.12974  ORF Transcript_5011/g.12974 Transcript_5011/m.12974 type:complete len:273 (+) Transcript_5011:73-891(+)
MTHPKVKEAKERGKIEWQMWANVLAVCGGCLLILGGIIGQFGFENDAIATFSIAWGVMVCLIEWPRSKRLRGNTMTRLFQGLIVKILEKFGKFWINLYFRSTVYIGAAIPTFFCLPCVFGGVVTIISGVVYMVAAFKGETWKPLYPRGARGPKTGSVIKAPTYAPPRRPSDRGREDGEESLVSKPAMPAKAAPAPRSAAPNAPPPSRPVPKPRNAGGPKRPPPQLQLNAGANDWSSAVDDETGQTYYYNSKTNETSWDMPSVMNPMYSSTGI